MSFDSDFWPSCLTEVLRSIVLPDTSYKSRNLNLPRRAQAEIRVTIRANREATLPVDLPRILYPTAAEACCPSQSSPRNLIMKTTSSKSRVFLYSIRARDCS